MIRSEARMSWGTTRRPVSGNSGDIERWWERNKAMMRYYSNVTDAVTLYHQVESAFPDPNDRLDALVLARSELPFSTAADARLAQEIAELAMSLHQHP